MYLFYILLHHIITEDQDGRTKDVEYFLWLSFRSTLIPGLFHTCIDQLLINKLRLRFFSSNKPSN